MNKLESNEVQLIGKWQTINGVAMADEVCNRIEYLITKVLIKITTSDDGWSILYRDKEDGRYWELTFPESELHGGGPPTLTCVSADNAKKRYKIV